MLEALECEVRDSREELAKIKRGQAKFEKENLYLRKYFKEYGPTKFKLMQRERQLATLELEETRKQLKKLKRASIQNSEHSLGSLQSPAANVNSLQVGECRSILQQITNIVYATSPQVPNLRCLPETIRKLVASAGPSKPSKQSA